MATNIGKLKLRKGDEAEAFWPLDPAFLEDFEDGFVCEADVAPSTSEPNFNTLVMPPQYAIFDIVIHCSNDVDSVTPDTAEALYVTTLQGCPYLTETPLLMDKDRYIRVAFAVYIPDGEDSFTGTLTLEVKIESSTRKLELPLAANRFDRVDNLFIYFIAKLTHPQTLHGWCKFKTNPDAEVTLETIRENNRYKKIHRRTKLKANGQGWAAYDITRDVLGVFVGHPMVFKMKLVQHAPRSHLFILNSADLTGNTNKAPFSEPATRTKAALTKVSDLKLSKYRILLDPGHGVVYDNTSHRRSQEWLAAQLLADEIRSVLVHMYDMPTGNIQETRTAGFALIAPEDVNVASAPETGEDRYAIDFSDPSNRTIRSDSSSTTLRMLSDLLLTEHGDDDAALPVSGGSRRDLLENNRTAIENAASRAITAWNSKWRIAAGSFSWGLGEWDFTVQAKQADGTWPDAGGGVARWHDTDDRYEIAVSFGTPIPAPRLLSINSTDIFALTPALLANLEDRTARWSIQCEIGTAEGEPNFPTRARAAMVAMGAQGYMSDKMRWSNDQPAGSAFLTNGPFGWSVDNRTDYFNNGPHNWDFILTIHENAADNSQPRGGCTLIAANNPPEDQKRIAKTLLKYVDPFDYGLYSYGIYPHASAGMVISGAHRTKHAYLELEFMTTRTVEGEAEYQYEPMLEPAYLERVANQLAQGMIEWLTDKQDKDTFLAVQCSDRW